MPVAPATPTQTAATAKLRRNTSPACETLSTAPASVAPASACYELQVLEIRTRSFQVANTISMSTKAKPNRNPYSCAR